MTQGYDILIVWCIFVKFHAWCLKHLRWNQYCNITHIETAAICVLTILKKGLMRFYQFFMFHSIKKSKIRIFEFSLHSASSVILGHLSAIKIISHNAPVPLTRKQGPLRKGVPPFASCRTPFMGSELNTSGHFSHSSQQKVEALHSLMLQPNFFLFMIWLDEGVIS